MCDVCVLVIANVVGRIGAEGYVCCDNNSCLDVKHLVHDVAPNAHQPIGRYSTAADADGVRELKDSIWLQVRPRLMRVMRSGTV